MTTTPSIDSDDQDVHGLETLGFLDRDDSSEQQHPSAPRRRVRSMRGQLPAWFVRRGWLLAVAILTGAFAGHLYGSHARPSFAAQTLLAVPSGATPAAPGSDNEAGALAITYAAILGRDGAVLAPAAAQLGVPLDQLEQHLSVSVQTGTSVIAVRYTAPTEQEAVHGANVIATTISGDSRRNQVVPAQTIGLVQLATSAARNGAIAKYGLEVGFLLGLLLGGLLVLVAERIDPRADRSEDITGIFDRPVAAVPSELSLPEFARAVAATEPASSTLTLAPLRRRDVEAADKIECAVAQAFVEVPAVPAMTVSEPLEDRTAHRLHSGDGVVLLVRSGERLREVGDALERLNLMGMPPIWVLLLDRHARIA